MVDMNIVRKSVHICVHESTNVQLQCHFSTKKSMANIGKTYALITVLVSVFFRNRVFSEGHKDWVLVALNR